MDIFAQIQGFAPFFVAVVIAEVLDMVFGLSNAVINKEVSSSKMREGISHKVGILGLLVASAFVEICCSFMELPIDLPIVAGVAAWLVLMEIGSICEILVKMNPDLANAPVLSMFDVALDTVSGKRQNDVH